VILITASSIRSSTTSPFTSVDACVSFASILYFLTKYRLSTLSVPIRVNKTGCRIRAIISFFLPQNCRLKHPYILFLLGLFEIE
jgi:hypothetical protein